MNMPVLDPKGLIAGQESTLLIQASLLMLIVMVAVFALLFYFAWHYRAGNTRATYMPNWQHAKMDELIWWAIPFEIVLVLGALTYTSTHALDPKKPIISATPAVEIEVVALPWQWLFIYPAYGVASMNVLYLPAHTPLSFKITADAPMNSFWIPALGGQIYAMTGMQTSLHLQADEEGVYQGLSANYSGEGFSQMKFEAHALSPDEFLAWVEQTRKVREVLNLQTYATLAKPNSHPEEQYFGSVSPILFGQIISKFNH